MGGASAPPFFRHFPFKIGDLEAHPGKIRGRQRKIRGRQSKIWGRQRKTMRREGKIGRQKVFSEVKNVNVESPKNRSKLLDFWSGSLPQPRPKGKGFSNFDIRLYINCLIDCLINCPINSVQFVNNSCSIRVPGNNSCSKQNQFVPKQMKAALMNPFMSILGEERGKSAPKKPTILSVFSVIRH